MCGARAGDAYVYESKQGSQYWTVGSALCIQ